MPPADLIEEDERWFKRCLLAAFLLGLIALAATIAWVRPGNVSADETVIDAVKALGAAAVAIFLAAANQLGNVLTDRREQFRLLLWGPILAITLAAALAVPIYVIAFGFYSKRAVVVLIAVIIVEMFFLIGLILSRRLTLPEAATAAALPVEQLPSRVAPPLSDDMQLRLEAAIAEHDRAAQEFDEATREADEAAQKYDDAAADFASRRPLR